MELKVNSLSFSYGAQSVLRDISLSAADGEVIAVRRIALENGSSLVALPL